MKPIGILPYIGGKHRLASRIVDICRAFPGDTFVDVFGGSASVMLAASRSFTKLVYNDIDGDLVNFFRVLANDHDRVRLFRMLKALPVSRRIYEEDFEQYRAGGLSFCRVVDPVERARKTLYRHLFTFGGKVYNGGFQVSFNDPDRIKEVTRYRNVLKKLAQVGAIFRQALIENLHYAQLISTWGNRKNVVLYVDPPYDGTEHYYTRGFARFDHLFLAEQLAEVSAPVVCSYYATDLIRSLYPKKVWTWQPITATRNSCFTIGNKATTQEYVISKTYGNRP